MRSIRRDPRWHEDCKAKWTFDERLKRPAPRVAVTGRATILLTQRLFSAFSRNETRAACLNGRALDTENDVAMTNQDAIRYFLDSRRIALVEASPNSMDFSRYVFKALRNRGLDVIPVHPWAQEIAGQRAYKSVRDIPQGIDAALLMIPPEKSADVTRDCIDGGAHVVWFHRGLGRGAATDESVRMCEEAGVLVVPGECPLMYLERPGFMHSLSAFARSTSNVFETVPR